jgi:hypothetical protein
MIISIIINDITMPKIKMLLNKNNNKVNGVNIFQDLNDSISTSTNTSDNDSLDITSEL